MALPLRFFFLFSSGCPRRLFQARPLWSRKEAPVFLYSLGFLASLIFAASCRVSSWSFAVSMHLMVGGFDLYNSSGSPEGSASAMFHFRILRPWKSPSLFGSNCFIYTIFPILFLSGWPFFPFSLSLLTPALRGFWLMGGYFSYPSVTVTLMSPTDENVLPFRLHCGRPPHVSPSLLQMHALLVLLSDPPFTVPFFVPAAPQSLFSHCKVCRSRGLLRCDAGFASFCH